MRGALVHAARRRAGSVNWSTVMSCSHLVVFGVLCIFGLAAAQTTPSMSAPPAPADGDLKSRSIYTFETRTLDGRPARLADYNGKVTLIVNVASECGYTPQYEGLEKLAGEFKDRGFVVLGFPCNDFGGQEPGTPEEIRAFCTGKYHVTFPLFEKISVKPGESQHIVYKSLEAKAGALPRWNFGKYLVSRDGKTAKFFDSKVTPESKELRNAIETALAAK